MELTDGVYAFPQSIDREGVEVTINPAAVSTPRGVMLIDTGFPGQLDQVEANLSENGFAWSDVTEVLVTHQDGDHAGALSEVLDRTDATVYAHATCAPYVDGREHPIKSPEGERYPPVPVDVAFEDELVVRTDAGPMEVLYTPGHAPGHVSLYFPEAALLLAADALTADEDGLQGPSEQFTLEMDEALDSARTFVDRDIEGVLCYHGGYVEADADRISQIVEERR